MSNLPYLYKWIHIPTGKWYIGSKSCAKANPSHHDRYICSSEIVKPLVLESPQEWHYTILCIGPAKYIRDLESKFLCLLDAKNNPNSFNRSIAVFDPGNKLGTKESMETRKKKSVARQGIRNPSWGKKGELSPLFGRKASPDRKRKISEALSGKKRSKSHCDNISKSLKGNPNVGFKGEKNPSWGRPEVAAHLNIQITNECPHCGKILNSLGNFHRWHGSNCKLLLTTQKNA